MPERLSADDLAAYAAYADATQDKPLAALVAELRERRDDDVRELVVIVTAPAHVAALQLQRAHRVDTLVLVPNGLRIIPPAHVACRIEAYDPDAPPTTSTASLRARLVAHGVPV